MANKKDYFDKRNDFDGPDKDKRNHPKRPQHVPIEENPTPENNKRKR